MVRAVLLLFLSVVIGCKRHSGTRGRRTSTRTSRRALNQSYSVFLRNKTNKVKSNALKQDIDLAVATGLSGRIERRYKTMVQKEKSNDQT